MFNVLSDYNKLVQIGGLTNVILLVVSLFSMVSEIKVSHLKYLHSGKRFDAEPDFT